MAQARTRPTARSTLDRVRQDRGLGVLTAVAMAAFVVIVYVVVVIGGGALLGRTSPSLWLSVLATAIVAVAFDPIRRGVRRGLARALHQDRLSPYQVLARFPATVTGSFPVEELPERMAKVLAEGTGTAGAEVWQVVNGQLELAAQWPPAQPTAAAQPSPPAQPDLPTTPARPPIDLNRPGHTDILVDGQRHSIAVRERGEILGALTVALREGQQLAPVEERLFAGLAAQSGLILRVAGLRAELEQQLANLERRSTELRTARRDLVTRQDAERQRLERNIHDGAQQELIALLVNLRLAQTLLGRAPERGARLLAEQAAAARDTIATLTALSRGLYPRLLTDAGPVAALHAAVASSPVPVSITSMELPRLATAQEAAIYFCCLEAVQNATKHANASEILIDLRCSEISSHRTDVELTITDDGQGFDVSATSRGGLANIRDRIESLHGSVLITSERGRGTIICATLPVTTAIPAASLR